MCADSVRVRKQRVRAAVKAGLFDAEAREALAEAVSLGLGGTPDARALAELKPAVKRESFKNQAKM